MESNKAGAVGFISGLGISIIIMFIFYNVNKVSLEKVEERHINEMTGQRNTCMALIAESYKIGYSESKNKETRLTSRIYSLLVASESIENSKNILSVSSEELDNETTK